MHHVIVILVHLKWFETPNQILKEEKLDILTKNRNTKETRKK